MPTLPDYSLRIAEAHVNQYSARHDELMARHREAMECRDCEEWLRSGIEACKWLRHAEETLKEAAREGFDVPPEAVDVLNALFRRWLLPCPNVRKLMSEYREKGYSIAGVAEFEAACECVTRHVQKEDAFTDLEEVLQGGGFSDEFWAEASQLRQSAQ